MKKQSLLILTLLSVGLSGCNSETVDYGQFSNLFSNLQTGFSVSGSLVNNVTYYTTLDYTAIDENHPATTHTYEYDLTYTNTEDYQGADRRYYEVIDGERKYLQGENTYNDNGYVMMNYLDYDNSVYSDGEVYDDGYNRTPFSASLLIDPFALMDLSDFAPLSDGTGVTLNALMSTILFSTFYSNMDDIPSDITVSEITFTYDGDNLKGSFTSAPYQTTETSEEGTYNLYAEYRYEGEFTLTNIGTANSKDLVRPEPEKPENAPLANALKNMKNSDVTVYRHLYPVVNGEEVQQQECVNMYFDKDTFSAYNQCYDAIQTEQQVPNAPTANDFYMYSSEEDGRYLMPYVQTGYNDETEQYTFGIGGSYSSLYGLSFYDCLPLLCNDSSDYEVSANTFNKNEDGSYSPINDNLPYIGVELLIPPFAAVSWLAYGYTTECNIYLTEDEQYIDHVDFYYDDGQGTLGLLTLTYSNVGTTDVPFDITVA